MNIHPELEIAIFKLDLQLRKRTTPTSDYFTLF